MIAYKFLRAGRRSLITRTVWPEPGASATSWLEAGPGRLVPCRHGLHACRVQDLAYWIADELWEVELASELEIAGDAVVARRARLVRPIEAWGQGGSLAFAQGCVARALAHVEAAGVPADHLARGYAEQAQQLEQTSYLAALSHAAALAFALTAPPSAAKVAFRAERTRQGTLLAEAVGLAS